MSTLDTITAFLRGKGLSSAQIAGVEGNLQVESKLNPTAYNPREQAIGLAQWEGARRTGPNGLQAFAARTGSTETNLNTQLAFMWSELTGPEHAALIALQGTSTPAAAAAVFDQKYERSSGASRTARVDAANAIAGGSATFAGQSATGAADAPASGGGVALPAWLDVAAHALVPAYGLADLGGGAVGLVGAAFTKIGTWLLDAWLICMGVVLLVVALVLLARGGEHQAPAVTIAAPARKSGAAGGAVEDAAVAA